MAQQTAELAVKSVYMFHGWPFPYVHDLGQLLHGLKSKGVTITPEVQQADQLTDYAVATRYPGSGPPVGKPEYEDAVRIAAAVLAWAESFGSRP
jgi:HEPN domain-containing protein